MTSRERLRRIVARQPADRCGFWLGNPYPDTWPIYHAHFGTKTGEELRVLLRDDFRWICPQFYDSVYADPRCRRLMSVMPPKQAHGDAGPMAKVQTVAEVEAFPWPKPEHFQFDEVLRDLRNAGPVYRASGFWTCFYHEVMDLFGMEQYLVNMYENPEVVEAVTNKVCQYYYDANEQFFAAAGDEVDAFFFGNDFGTQLDTICGPEQFDCFIMPWFRKFTQQGHRWGKQVILHSCGAIHRVIDRLIDAGVDCLHPLQALAANMDAGTLARDFGGRVAFLGGIDTQRLLVHATPEEVKADVRRVKKLLGPHVIVSPSHEALLPNVPPENVLAMAEAATE